MARKKIAHRTHTAPRSPRARKKEMSLWVTGLFILGIALVGVGITGITQVGPKFVGGTCSDASVVLVGGTYYPFTDNSGNVELSVLNDGNKNMIFNVYLTYPAGVETYSQKINSPANDLTSFIVKDVKNNIKEITIQSTECQSVQDLIKSSSITNL